MGLFYNATHQVRLIPRHAAATKLGSHLRAGHDARHLALLSSSTKALVENLAASPPPGPSRAGLPVRLAIAIRSAL